MTARGGLVAAVERESPAERAGLCPGDVVEAVDGRPLTDVLVWSWAAAEDQVDVRVSSPGSPPRPLELERDRGEAWGLEFEGAIFDGIRTCRNECTFCFLGGLPGGLRPSLYLRDDDYRLSFLFGNFVTLTNLEDADVARIVEMRLTPLHVSVHAADADVRRRLLCPREGDRGLERLDELLAADIEVHAQIVLVPGVNDGPVLDETLGWLAARPGVVSVGIVPASSTRHTPRAGAALDAGAAAELLGVLEPWRTRMRSERGVSWVHAADEMWLAVGRPLPPGMDYDGYPQFENGIGLVRSFIDEFGALEASGGHGLRPVGTRTDGRHPAPVLVTGTLFAPVLEGLVRDSLAEHGIRVLPVRNRYLGGDVSVAGLLTGEDIVRAVRDHGGRGDYFVPEVVFNDDGVTLDDQTVEMLAASTGGVVRAVSADARGLVAALTGTGRGWVEHR